MSERTTAVAGPDPVAEYKAILKRVLDNRPSGTRQRLAKALGKNRSFISQIANPAYPCRSLCSISRRCSSFAISPKMIGAIFSLAIGAPIRAALPLSMPPHERGSSRSRCRISGMPSATARLTR